MNSAVYKHLLQTYGRKPAVWLGLFTELLRTLMQRVWVTIIVAQIATNLAAHNIAGARHHVLMFLIIYAAGAVIGTAGDLAAILAEDGEYEVLTMAFYRRLTGKDMSFYRDNQTGYLVSLFRQYTDSTILLVRLLRGDVAKMFVSLVVPVIVLFVANRKLGLVVCVIVVVQILYVVWSSSKANSYRKITHEIYRRMTGEMSDHITNIVAFKSAGLEERAAKQIGALAHEETQAFWLRRKVTVSLDLPRELVTAGGVALAFLVVVNGASGNPNSVGLVMLTLTYMFQIVRSVSELPSLMILHDDFITKLYPPLEYLGGKHETIKDPVRPRKLAVRKGEIRVNHVGFSYPVHDEQGKSIPVFGDLDITFKAGEQVGVVGLSGAGKSTLVSLLMRFDDVSSGSITIDGLDIRKVRQSDLHRNIAYVPQEPLLFHRTIRENIAYFTENASEQDIIAAAKAAYAHDFIQKLPKGYDTMVGERGIKLSGGQKQRVVIARSILKNAPIMIFDEATSALDTESEKIIQSALPKIIGKHTAIVIAHRLSTVAGLDRIIVMHGGEIAESGTHDELLQLGGRYHALWQKQIASSIS